MTAKLLVTLKLRASFKYKGYTSGRLIRIMQASVNFLSVLLHEAILFSWDPEWHQFLQETAFKTGFSSCDFRSPSAFVPYNMLSLLLFRHLYGEQGVLHHSSFILQYDTPLPRQIIQNYLKHNEITSPCSCASCKGVYLSISLCQSDAGTGFAQLGHGS